MALWMFPHNAVVTAVKNAEDGNGITIRDFESIGKECKVILRFGFSVKEAFETDIMEWNKYILH